MVSSKRRADGGLVEGFQGWVDGAGGRGLGQQSRENPPPPEVSDRRARFSFVLGFWLQHQTSHPVFLLNPPETVPRRIRPASRKDPATGPTGQRSPRARLRAIAGTTGLVRRHFRRPAALAPSSNRPRIVPEPSPNRPARFRPASRKDPAPVPTGRARREIHKLPSRSGGFPTAAGPARPYRPLFHEKALSPSARGRIEHKSSPSPSPWLAPGPRWLAPRRRSLGSGPAVKSLGSR